MEELLASPVAWPQKMVEGGWLVKHGQRYEPTEQGLKAAE
jgi:hypothetical protein